MFFTSIIYCATKGTFKFKNPSCWLKCIVGLNYICLIFYLGVGVLIFLYDFKNKYNWRSITFSISIAIDVFANIVHGNWDPLIYYLKKISKFL